MRSHITVQGQICKVRKTAFQFNPETAYLFEVVAPEGFTFRDGSTFFAVDCEGDLLNAEKNEELVAIKTEPAADKVADDQIYDKVTDLVNDTSLEQVLAALVRYTEDYRDDDLGRPSAAEKECANKLVTQLKEATDTAEELSAMFYADCNTEP